MKPIINSTMIVFTSNLPNNQQNAFWPSIGNFFQNFQNPIMRKIGVWHCLWQESQNRKLFRNNFGRSLNVESHIRKRRTDDQDRTA